MAQRLAAALSLLMFALCLMIGGFEAGNGFATVVGRAIVAMAGTFVVAYVIGRMASKMIDENVQNAAIEAREKMNAESANNSSPAAR